MSRDEQLEFFKAELNERCGNACELCSSSDELKIFEVVMDNDPVIETCVTLCATCRAQAPLHTGLDADHLRCLQDSAWSEVPAVQALAARMLKRLEGVSWAMDLCEQLYLDEETQAWADDDSADSALPSGVKTLDSNGVELFEGDTVHIIKDLEVRGAGFTAKRGTVVKGISLTNNPEHIEGRVNKTRIVLKTCFLKKA